MVLQNACLYFYLELRIMIDWSWMNHIIFQDVVSAAANYDHQQVTMEDCARMLTFITLLKCCCKCLFAAILFPD